MKPREVIIMAAPNGAHKTKQDHAALPMRVDEIAAEAAQCFAAGASVLHAHVRDADGRHSLDPNLYRDLLAQMQRRAPQMHVQITTEAAGVFTREQQIACVQSVRPRMASVALREIIAPTKQSAAQEDAARAFYHWCQSANVHVQHILYDAQDLKYFLQLRARGVIPAGKCCVLLVLGRYAKNRESHPDDLQVFSAADLSELDWFVCAFGAREQDCVAAAVAEGGHARVGFENNMRLPNGAAAESSAALVAALAARLRAEGRAVADTAAAARILF